MALDTGHHEKRHQADSNQNADRDWPMDRVIRWLEDNGWGAIAPVFQENNICGQQFINLNREKLDALCRHSTLPHKECWRLGNGIQALRSNPRPIAQGYANVNAAITDRYYRNLRPIPSGDVGRLRPSDGPPGSLNPPFKIPERTSSSPQQLHRIMEKLNYDPRSIHPPLRGRTQPTYLNINPTSRPAPLPVPSSSSGGNEWINSPISPRNHPSDSEEQWRMTGKRVPQYIQASSNPSNLTNTLSKLDVSSQSSQTMSQRQPLQQQSSRQPSSVQEERIQVTADSDTFFSLTVTDLREASAIKQAIVKKMEFKLKEMGLVALYDNFDYYHENGDRSDIPLNDEELVALCRMSDKSLKNRILVKPREGAEVANRLANGSVSPRPIPISSQRPQGQYDMQHGYVVSPTRPTASGTLGRSFETQPSFLLPSRWDNPPSSSPPGNGFVTPQPTGEGRLAGDDGQPFTGTSGNEHQADNNHEDRDYIQLSDPDTRVSEPYAPENGATAKGGKRVLATSDLWAVPPKYNKAESTPVKTEQKQPVSLWAVPPQHGTLSEDTRSQDEVEKPRPVASLWAVPPLKSREKNSSDPSTESRSSEKQTHGHLWPVGTSADDAQENVAIGPSSSSDTSEPTHVLERKYSEERLNVLSKDDQEETNGTRKNKPKTISFQIPEAVEKLTLRDEAPAHSRNNQHLHIQIPSLADGSSDYSSGKSPHTPHLSDSRTPNTSNSGSPVSTEHNLDDPEGPFQERPTVDRLYCFIDKYLPNHDLDTEIVVDTPQMGAVTPTPTSRRLQGHKKSIRAAAKEAHHNWRNAMNVVRTNNILRRRSTKMWDRKVEQVKPGMVVKHEKDSAATSETSGDKPEPTKMQWMRGQLIGRGSFGRVFHAFNMAAGEWIAVKQVDIPAKHGMMDAKMQATIDLLYREIILLKDLDHENIVQYLGYDRDDKEGHIYIFLEYVPGGSIASAIAKNGPFEEVLCRFFTRQILLGLEYLHSRNIMHRDIKSGNILVDQNGVCKITDFGLSKPNGVAEAYNPDSNTLMKGTVYWMAPEVVTGTSYSAKIDIWSLGCTVVEMLTGSHPWINLNMLAALYNLGKFQVPPLPEGISSEATDFLNKCFTINAEVRPTADELLLHPFVRQDPSFKFKEYMRVLQERKQ